MPVPSVSALLDWDLDSADEHWEQVEALIVYLGPEGAAQEAVGLCGSADALLQAAGLDILGELAQVQEYPLEPLLIIAERLSGSDADEVRFAAAGALSWLDDARVEDLLLRFICDADSDVRRIAVRNLPRPSADYSVDHPVVRALMLALDDCDPRVRDWAAFEVGSLPDVDSPQIRDALADHLDEDDEESDTGAEAATGLARRGDPRVLPVLLEQLADPEVRQVYVEAAGDLADERLLPALYALRHCGWHRTAGDAATLAEAIGRCETTAGAFGWRPCQLPSRCGWRPQLRRFARRRTLRVVTRNLLCGNRE